MAISENRESTQAELNSSLAQAIEDRLKHALISRGCASLVVSGGSTPRPLFKMLSELDLPWDKVTITLADERWVASDSADSNEAMLRESFLTNFAAKANFVALKNGAESAVEGLIKCQLDIANIGQPFDLVMLGMGLDGHTASLFPGVSEAALDLDNPNCCAAISPIEAPHERMTLTAKTLLYSRNIILHIVGEQKWQVYQAASQGTDIDEMPIRVILHQSIVPVDVFWSP